MALAVARDQSDVRAELGPDDIAAFETDVLAGFVLARAAAGQPNQPANSGRRSSKAA